MPKTRKPKTVVYDHKWAWTELQKVLKETKRDSERYTKEYAKEGNYNEALEEESSVRTMEWIIDLMNMSDITIKTEAKKTAKK